MSDHIVKATLELIRRTATVLPGDVRAALERACASEEPETARITLGAMLQNVRLAEEGVLPLCQDTGTPVFWISYPASHSQAALREDVLQAGRRATVLSYLRPNAVDSTTGRNSGDNTGAGFPVFHFEQWGRDHLKVELLLKGGGSENVSAQYDLPDTELGAGRDLDGVKRCVLNAVWKAQGRGCPPGVIGVAVGGDRETGHAWAKRALLGSLDEPNPDTGLDGLERGLRDELNRLGIGPMGLGGKTTVLAVKAVKPHRHPASYFVTVAYGCWALRRLTMTIRDGEISYD